LRGFLKNWLAPDLARGYGSRPNGRSAGGGFVLSRRIGNMPKIATFGIGLADRIRFGSAISAEPALTFLNRC
jgi:hypothetical protein